jgi:hypothetical protein
MAEISAAEWALKQVEAVREEPEKRLELLEQTYHGPTGQAPHHPPFPGQPWLSCAGNRRATCSRPLDARPAGSHGGGRLKNACCGMAVRQQPEAAGDAPRRRPRQYRHGCPLLPILAGGPGTGRTANLEPRFACRTERY